MWSSARVNGPCRERLALARRGAILLLALPLCASTVAAQSSKAVLVRVAQSARVNQVSFRGDHGTMEVEIQTSTAITPQSQSLASPDRIVVDFPGAFPAEQLRSMKLNYGPLKAIRAGLFSANPPITRVVLDLDGPQSYQVVASDNKVTLKFRLPPATGQTPAAPVGNLQSDRAEPDPGAAPQTPVAPPAPPVTVSFQQGQLQIHAQRATLAQVLFEVQKQTGAEIPIPAGAEQEMVAADLGPAPPRDVLTALLTGSRYNFVFVDNERDHSLQKAILSLR